MAETDAQRAARQRNHRIWRLRGLYHNLSLLDEPRRSIAQNAVDEELKELGAEPETKRVEERRARLMEMGYGN